MVDGTHRTAPEGEGRNRRFQEAPVAAVERLAKDVFRIDILFDGAAHAVPGQFVTLRLPRTTDPLLARPFSIHRRLDTGVSVLFRVVGRGTDRLSRLRAGDVLDVLGPLGNGFPLEANAGWTALIAAGMGAAPMVFTAQEGVRLGVWTGSRAEVLYGARGEGELIVTEDFEKTGLPLAVATDDGSAGFRGTVTGLLASRAAERGWPDAVLAVGPAPVYAALHEILSAHDCTCLVSLETHMACGVGVCRGCVTRGRGPDGAFRYVDVCKSGPVFNVKELAFDGLENVG